MATKTKSTESNNGVFGSVQNYKRVNPACIKVQPGWNPRTHSFEEIDELASDIEANGLRVALQVRKDGEEIYLVDGERRLKALMLIMERNADVKAAMEKEGVKCEFVDAKLSEVERLFMALSANRSVPLSPLEEGDAYARLHKWGVTTAEITRRVGKKWGYVASRMDLALGATPETREALMAGRINFMAALDAVKKTDDAAGQAEKVAAVAAEMQTETISGKAVKKPRKATDTAKAAHAEKAEKKAVKAESKTGKTSKPDRPQSNIMQQVAPSLPVAPPVPARERSKPQNALIAELKKRGFGVAKLFVRGKSEVQVWEDDGQGTTLLAYMREDGDADVFSMFCGVGLGDTAKTIASNLDALLGKNSKKSE